MEKNFGISKPRCSEHVLPVTLPLRYIEDTLQPHDSSVYSKRAYPPRTFVGLFSSWKFVRKPLPGGGAFVNSSRRG